MTRADVEQVLAQLARLARAMDEVREQVEAQSVEFLYGDEQSHDAFIRGWHLAAQEFGRTADADRDLAAFIERVKARLH